MPKRSLASIDFSEVDHYVWCLQGAADHPVHRRELAEVLGELLGHLDHPSVGIFLLRVQRFAAWGGSLDGVRDSFAEMCMSNAGWAAAQQLRKEQVAAAIEHGKRGGRPPTPGKWIAEWRRMLIEKRARNPSLSLSAACEQIAAEWRDGVETRAARTIEDAVRDRK